jgi:hypothetical protein
MSDAPGEYADSPPSLSERRAIATDDCRLLSPRDLLIRFLRRIDNGEFVPDGLIVTYIKKEGDGTRTGMIRSNLSIAEAVGAIEIAKHDLLLAASVAAL